MTTDLIDRFPAVEDLRRVAKKRIPRFSWAHLDSGTGEETTHRRNQTAFDSIRMLPRWSESDIKPRLKTRIFGQNFEAPFGIAPLGATGLLWPGGEHILAETAYAHGIPYCLSTAACETLETVGAIARDRSWFQLYPSRDRAIRDDLIRRAMNSGFTALIVTIDVPVYSMRERQRRAGLTVPTKIGFRTLMHILARPGWALATLRHGAPAFRLIEGYVGNTDMAKTANFLLHELSAPVDEDYLREIRDQWHGPLMVKGILSPEGARRAVALGVDGLIVSNHGGRQFDAAPPTIQVLPEIIKAVGAETTVLFDSGVRGGLDIIRALALGADFVLLGRAFAYGIAALGHEGGNHVCRLLKENLAINMTQLAVETPETLRQLPIWTDR
ncbi:MAG: alpha-hydroxy acid oxidase [Pseudomonadota bacterium]